MALSVAHPVLGQIGNFDTNRLFGFDETLNHAAWFRSTVQNMRNVDMGERTLRAALSRRTEYYRSGNQRR